MRFRRRTLLIVLVLLVVVTLLLGERRLPTGPDIGGGSPAASGGAPEEFVVATFNIHGCKGVDGRRDAGRVAACLDEVDILGLNEVHGSFWTEPENQIAQLADLCGVPSANVVFAPAETQWFGFKRFGNGLLSDRAILAWQRIPLPRRYDHSCRNMLVAKVEGPNEPITLLVTHITRSNERERKIHLEKVLELFVALDPPAVLLADLNTPPGDPRMDRFLAESDATDALCQGGLEGNDRVDWILVRGLECLGSKRVENDASDHPLFTARLTSRKIQ